MQMSLTTYHGLQAFHAQCIAFACLGALQETYLGLAGSGSPWGTPGD